MSGGFFDYSQQRFENEFVEPFIEKLKRFKEYRNMKSFTDEDDFYRWFANDISEDTMEEFRNAARIMKQAVVYAQRIDWFLSGDDGEDSFHERLKKELELAKLETEDL